MDNIEVHIDSHQRDVEFTMQACLLVQKTICAYEKHEHYFELAGITYIEEPKIYISPANPSMGYRVQISANLLDKTGMARHWNMSFDLTHEDIDGLSDDWFIPVLLAEWGLVLLRENDELRDAAAENTEVDAV